MISFYQQKSYTIKNVNLLYMYVHLSDFEISNSHRIKVLVYLQF